MACQGFTGVLHGNTAEQLEGSNMKNTVDNNISASMQAQLTAATNAQDLDELVTPAPTMKHWARRKRRFWQAIDRALRATGHEPAFSNIATLDRS